MESNKGRGIRAMKKVSYAKSVFAAVCFALGVAPSQELNLAQQPAPSKATAATNPGAQAGAQTHDQSGSPSGQRPGSQPAANSQSGVTTIRVPVNLVNVLFTV